MARLESTSVSVSPEEESVAIETHEKFGWELKSSQEIFNKDSHNELRGDSVYSVTETTNYVKLVFQRDKDMPYYKEVCEIENKYYEALNRKPVYTHSKFLTVLGIIIAVVGVFFILAGDIPEKLLGVAIAALGIFTVVMKLKSNSKKEAEYNEKMSQWNDECSMLIAEVENYI